MQDFDAQKRRLPYNDDKDEDLRIIIQGSKTDRMIGLPFTPDEMRRLFHNSFRPGSWVFRKALQRVLRTQLGR